AGYAASHAAAHEAEPGFAADAAADKAVGGGCSRTRARARRTFFEKPRIHGLATGPNVIEGERTEAEFGDQNRSGVFATLDDDGVLYRDAVAKRLRAAGGGDVGGVEEIFCAPGGDVERAAVFAGG